MANTPSYTPPSHPLNIRLSVPLIGRRYFLTLIGGSEKLGLERRSAERDVHPIKKAGNIFFIAGFVVIFYAIAFVAIALQSSIIEF